MSEKVTVYCVVCGDKLKVFQSHIALGRADISCAECTALAKTRFAPSERRMIHDLDKAVMEDAQQKPSTSSSKVKTPVIAESLNEYVRWLVSKRYSRRDYVYCEPNVGLNTYRSNVFVLLSGAKKRTDWNGISNYIASHAPNLVIE
jgi:hypothetical protein